MADHLFALAFDHRTSLMTGFFEIEGEPSDGDVARARAAKLVIWEGLARAIDEGLVAREEAAALIDATYGTEAIAEARAAHVRVAMPVEASGRTELTFEQVRWRERLDTLDPAWAEVLVRYNPDGDVDHNARQRAALGALADHCRAADHRLMLELLVPPEPSQEGPDYDTAVRPGLMVRAIAEIRGDGIDADVWKVEGLDRREDCEAVARMAAAPCIVLGRDADRAAVDRWLQAGAGVDGFIGFAIGRSIWWEALQGFFAAGGTEEARSTAVAAIAAEYGRYVGVYTGSIGA